MPIGEKRPTRVPFPIEESLRSETLAALREAQSDLYTVRNRVQDQYVLLLLGKAMQSLEVAIDAIKD